MMRRLQRLYVRQFGLVMALVALLTSTVLTLGACAPKAIGGRSTANLTAAGGGIQALHGIEAVKYLDIIRDLAVDGEKIGKVKTSTAAAIVRWHRAAITTIDATPNGWKPSVLTGIDQLSATLTPEEHTLFDPYILSAKTIIQAVIS